MGSNPLKAYQNELSLKDSDITRNVNDMFSYSPATLVCFLTKEWYGFSAYPVNLFIKGYHGIINKRDFKLR